MCAPRELSKALVRVLCGDSMIAFLCSRCGAQLKIRDEQAGRRGKCPGCGRKVRAPGASPKLTPTHSGSKGDGDFLSDPPSGPSDGSDLLSDEGRLVFQPEVSASDEDYAFLAPAEGPGELGRLGNYRILKVLGIGGMGVVFEAEDLKLKRRVALKAMKPVLAAKEAARQRFTREAQATASIEHDHIVTIYQVDEDRGIPYLAMKLLQGESLDDRLKSSGGWLALSETLRIGREVAEGLAAAHSRGLIHRDIKPANIWLETPRDRVKIVDFGLARASSGSDGQLTQLGAIMGTPAYMAPEQAEAKHVDHRADLFSLGCVLYRMCTGQLPFKGKDTMSMLMALATQRPEPLRKVDPGLPQAFSDLVMQLLERDPDDRPRTAQEVAERLEEIDRHIESGKDAALARARAEGPLIPPPVRRPVTRTPTRQEVDQDTHPQAQESVPTAVPVEIDREAEREEKRKSVARRRRQREREREQKARDRKIIIWAIIAAVLIIGFVAFVLIKNAVQSKKDATTQGQGGAAMATPAPNLPILSSPPSS